MNKTIEKIETYKAKEIAKALEQIQGHNPLPLNEA